MAFEKGKSGNPGGRPRENNEVKALARQHTKTAIERLSYWLMSDNPKASVAAAIALLDRGFGKPTQAIELDGEVRNYVVSMPETTKTIEEWAEKHIPAQMQ